MQRSAKCQHVNFRIQRKRTTRSVRSGTTAHWTTLSVTFPLRFPNPFMTIGGTKDEGGRMKDEELLDELDPNIFGLS
jgi:hypothetical protein